MFRKPLFLSLALALGMAAQADAATAAADSDTDAAQAAPTSSRNHVVRPATRNRQTPPVDTKTSTLGTVSVEANLDAARNALSPDIGSSQYVITSKEIEQLPLGASTPLNQVLLQAPGVVQDSYGGIHVRGDHANLQYRINGVILPESISGFGQTIDPRVIENIKLLDGALPAQFGERTAAVVDITTKSGSALGNGGSVGAMVGANDTLNPNFSLYGNKGRWSWFVTANYLGDSLGMENPQKGIKAIHDQTHQGKAFADLTYLINDNTRLSVMAGYANNRFQIPNISGQTPSYQYLNQTRFDSSQLNENQSENTRFLDLVLQGKIADSTDYQISIGQRYSSVDYTPDVIGDLMFNGVASQISRSNRADTLQADFSTPLGDSHTLRYGLYGDFEQATDSSQNWVFPADADGNQTSTTPLQINQYQRFDARTWAAYVQDEWSLGEDWTINYGLRADRYTAFREESQISPRFGVIWQATDSTTVHAGYSRYFTPPASELISGTDIAAFAGTTNAIKNYGSNTPLAERSDYYDFGVSQSLGSHLTLGVDGYYRDVQRLQDEGQFGAAYIYSTFNYGLGRVRGVEFTANYENGPFSAYFNFAYSKAQGKDVITSQYNFSEAELAYIAANYIYLDHNQKLTSSGGLNWTLPDTKTKFGMNYLFGSGLRADEELASGEDIPNGARLPYYFQLNFSVSHDFSLPGTSPLHTQLAIVNALDRVYELRDGTGVGVGAPQWGPRRAVMFSFQKDFSF
ncbi:TonB-dependent receptor [Frateuria aurantia]